MLAPKGIHARSAAAPAAVLTLPSALAACTSSGQNIGPLEPLSLYGNNPSWTRALKQVRHVVEQLTGNGLAPATPTHKTTDVVESSNGHKLQDLAARGGISDLTNVGNAAQQEALARSVCARGLHQQGQGLQFADVPARPAGALQDRKSVV